MCKPALRDNLVNRIDNIIATPFTELLITEANVVLQSAIETQQKVKEKDEVIADLIDGEKELLGEDLEANSFDIDTKKAK